MNKTLVAASIAFVLLMAIRTTAAFETPRTPKPKASAAYGKVDGKVLAARRAKAAACALVNKGIPLLEAGEYDAAIKLFSDAIAQYPKLANAYRFRGIAFDYSDELDRAMTDLNHAIELEPNEPDNYYARGCVFVEKKDYDHARADFDLCIKAAPTAAVAYRRRARCWLHVGEYSKAIYDLSEAIRVAPELAPAYSDRGRLLLTIGEYARAIDDLTRAIELKPDDARSAIARGLSYYWQGEYDKCIADCDGVIRRNPKDSYAYECRGAALLMKASFDESIVDSTMAIELAFPARPTPLINRALARSEKGDFGKATQDLEAALRVSPHHQNATVLLAYNLAAGVDEESRDVRRANEIATSACKLTDWHDAPSLDVLGMTYAEAAEFEKAIEYTEKALSIARGFPNSSRLQQQIRKRIELYRTGKAYHNKWRIWANEYADHECLRTIYQPEMFSNNL